MKTISKKIIKYLGVAAIGILLIASCKSYLSIAPEVNMTDTDVFSTFLKFQGFLEDCYQCTVDITLPNAGTAEMNWNYGLDEGIESDHNQLSYAFETGNYWAWQGTSYSPFMGATGSPSTGTTQGYWKTGLWGIRKCNEAIKNINILKNGTGTAEEVNLILGQAYFFRAYLHFEILRHWGHIAYIDSVYGATDLIQPAPISYAACAARIDADLRTAVTYLPANWDSTYVGQLRTSGVNAVRVTRGSAWAVMGMNALYAGSPLMATDATSPNNPDSTHFDINQMKIAAEAYGEVLKLALPTIAGGNGAGGYDLEQWKSYQNNFRSNTAAPMNGKEVVWTYSWRQYKRWRYGEWAFASLSGWGSYLAPTQNYVEKFGMANGLPLADPASGYNPNNPFVNRDPRYNYCIISDHDRYMVTVKPPYNAPLSGTLSTSATYCDLFTGGWARMPSYAPSLTGYGQRKFNQIGWNNSDGTWGNNTEYDCPLIRLAGVLLEYAEAVNEAYGPTGHSLNCTLTAIDAVNKVRHRAMVGPYNATGTTHNDLYPYDFQEGGTPLPNVDPKYTANQATFREIIRTERCVELALEGKRWDDCRRWGVASSLHYREKYELIFDQGHTSFTRHLYTTSIFEPKDWWLPFPTAQVALYPAFKQNPGW